MRKLSINLPPRHRLDIQLIKAREGVLVGEPMLPSLTKLRQVRRGNKISRFFRHIFEHKKVKRILASNLALAVFASSLLPSSNSLNINDLNSVDEIVIQNNQVRIATKRSSAYPVENVIISQGYHFFHRAIDFDGITGDTINPIMDGVVEEIVYSRFGLGNTVIINHNNNLKSVYAHLSKIEVKKGDQVTTFTKIGEMGSTGRAFGDHLHLEVFEAGRPINPLSILPPL